MSQSLQSEQPIRTAILGFSIAAMEALDNFGRPFLAVVPPEFAGYMEQYNLPYETWDFMRHNEQSHELAKTLAERGVEVAVPLYEETVEWAGALNGWFRDNPRLFTRYMLFRDKAMMKRRAQMHGIRVGVFEEVDERKDIVRFLKRIDKIHAKLDGEPSEMVHLKPLFGAGTMGHRVIRSEADVQKVSDDEFPCLLETHLDGQEFSCEVFIHNRKIRFLNINEYVHLGHSNFSPASSLLEEHRPAIRKAVEDLIQAFDIEYGMIHPEFFITPEGKVSFGEVAARVPGGHIFELIERAYGFNPFVGFVLCADPKTTEKELEDFFPREDEAKGYAGCLMVYPRQSVVTRVQMPEELLNDAYYEKHNLFVPANPKVAVRVAFGDHYGTIYFYGDDPERMKELLRHYEQVDFYTAEPLHASAPESSGKGLSSSAAHQGSGEEASPA